MMSPILSFVGKSGVGKTTLIEKLVAELKRRGYRIAVVKHHAHMTPIDGRGKDSWRFAEAGASVAIVSSPVEIVRFERVPRELTLNEIAAQIVNVDLILTEGFKREAAPKIEVSRAALGADLVARADELIAVVSDHPITLNLPRFDLDDAAGIAGFIEGRFLR
jgi:molybdopterin-guanine dinucleotide biosynthesis protein MobB